jgi:NitT/TauT family transport system substrate-binding protein
MTLERFVILNVVKDLSEPRILFLSLCLIVALLAPLRAFAQEQVIVSYDGNAGFQGPIWATKDLGLFEKYGLKAELVMVPGGARGMQALVSGSTQFAQGSATSPISLKLQGGDVVIVAAALNKFPFSVVAQKQIRRPAELIGKKIGIVNFGGSNELAVVLALKEWNIPRQAVTLVPSGEAAHRLVALTTGNLDATVLSPPYTTEAARLGFNILANLSEMDLPFPQTVITTRRSYLEKNRETVKRFVRAYSDAIYQFTTQKQQALAMYTKRLKQQNPKVLEDTYAYYAGKFSLPPRLRREGMQSALNLMGDKVAEAKPDLGQFVDESVIDELEREGFFSKLSGRSPAK